VNSDMHNTTAFCPVSRERRVVPTRNLTSIN